MPYVIENRSGNVYVVPDSGLNSDLSIDLVGRNYENYGEVIAKTQVDLLDSFANTTPPARATNGQLWYDTSLRVLTVYDSTNGAWKPLAPIVRENSTPTGTQGQNTEGTLYYNKAVGQLFIHDSTEYKIANLPGEISSAYSGEAALSNPSSYGTRLRNIFLLDTSNVHRAVLALTYRNTPLQTAYSNDEKIIALFSYHDEFTAQNANSDTEGTLENYYAELVEAGGIGEIIRPGINLRTDNASRIEISNISDRAQTSFAINTGSYGADGANISASQVFFDSGDNIPSSDNLYKLGNVDKTFSYAYVSHIKVGVEDALGYITKNSNTIVTIGDVADPIDTAFIKDLYIDGNIELPTTFSLGSNTNFIESIYADEITANTLTIGNYTLPETDGNPTYQLYTDGNGVVFWEEPITTVYTIDPGNGLSSVINAWANIGPSNVISRAILRINVGEGRGIDVEENSINVILDDYNTDELAEGSTNLYYTNARARAAIVVNDLGGDGNIVYDNLTGNIDYTGPSAAEVRAHFTTEGNIAYDQANGIISYTERTDNEIRGLFSNTNVHVTYNSSSGEIGFNGTNLNASTLEGLTAEKFIRKDATTVVDNNISTRWSGTANIIFGSDPATYTTYSQGNINYGATNLVHTGNVGTVTFTNAGAIVASDDITAFSDERLKTDLQKIENALNKVEELSGYTYTRIDNTNGRKTGLLAQDVQKVLPEAVTETENGYLSVAYGNMMGLIVESIKELKQEVENIKARLDKAE